MVASKTSSLESAQLLVRNKANPDILDKNGKNALAYALKAGNLKIVKLLSEITKEGFNSCVEILSESNIEIINTDGSIVNELAAVLDKIISSGHEMKDKLLEQATLFGNGNLTNFLLNKSRLTWSDAMIQTSLTNAILSDDVYCCQILKEYCKKNDIYVQLYMMHNMRQLILARGKTKIIEVFDIQDNVKDDCKPDNILSKIPKTKEFPYYEIMNDIKELVKNADRTSSGRLIKFTKLIDRENGPGVSNN